MERRYFEFESILSQDENKLPKIEIGTDVRSGMRFSLKFQNIDLIRNIFKAISYFASIKIPQYERHMIDYKDWYSNEIIRRVTQDTSFYETQSDAKKDVLKESLQRRNKLMKQIKRAMEFYEENKGKIDKMEKIRAIQQYSYPGPIISLTGDELIFENIIPFGDIYYQIALRLENEQKSGEEVSGFGWMELSKVFREDISSLKSPNNEKLQITNSKPRSDMRVLRRGDNQASIEINLSEKEKDFFSYAPFLNLLHDELNGIKLEFTPIQFFALVDHVVTKFPGKKVLTISIRNSKEFTLRSEKSTVYLGIATNIDTNIEFKVNSSVFIGLKEFLPFLETVEINIQNQLLGTKFTLLLNQAEVSIISVAELTSIDLYLHNALRSFVHRNSEQLFTEDYRPLVVGNHNRTKESGIYHREIIDDPKLIDNNRQRKTYILCEFHKDRILFDNYMGVYTSDNVESSVELVFPHLTLVWKCSCSGFNEKYKCHHTLAIFYLGIMEGELIA